VILIRTLKTYLAKDLAKTTALAAVAFTLVMTIFAILEPLRERGLSGQQALKLFGYSLPVMVSLTLPVAALFAATIVYGRFSQDNELMAARASGICTLSLLTPAVWLGAVVTVITLALGLYIAPKLLWQSQYALKNDLRRIVYHQLKTHHYIKVGTHIFHADRAFPDSGLLVGVVGLQGDDPDNATLLVASSAVLEFAERDAQTFLIFHPTDPAVMKQYGGTIGMAAEQRIQRSELPDVFEDEPKLYDWGKLWATWHDPKASSIVARGVRKIKRDICVRRFHEDVCAEIRARGRYARLREYVPPGAGVEASDLIVRAAEAVMEGGRDGGVRLKGPAPKPATGAASRPGGAPPGVLIQQRLGLRVQREFHARQAVVRGVWDDFRKTALATIALTDVDVREGGEGPDAGRHQDQYEIGPFAVPADIIEHAERLTVEDVYDNEAAFADWPEVHEKVVGLRDYTVRRLLRKVRAEIHQRLGYGISCMLMVMLGAALGLMLRGGQILAAFVISAIPTSLVIVVLLMGRQMIGNVGVPAIRGMAAIWGGVGALAAATGYLYMVRMRR